MPDVTQILEAIQSGDPQAASELLPLVYDELRRLAEARMRKESPDHTLEPTALVHEAYIRLVGSSDPGWQNRAHFFAAAAEAMRRILVDRARRVGARRHGGKAIRFSLDALRDLANKENSDIVALDDALQSLEDHDAGAAKLVKLRFFAGLTIAEAAEVLGISVRTAGRNWRYAQTWLCRALSDDGKQR